MQPAVASDTRAHDRVSCRDERAGLTSAAGVRRERGISAALTGAALWRRRAREAVPAHTGSGAGGAALPAVPDRGDTELRCRLTTASHVS